MKKALAVILLIIFVPLFILLTLYFSASNTMLNAKLITQKLAENNVYSVITEEVLPQFVTSLSAQEDMEELDQTSKQALEAMSKNLQSSIDANWLKTEFEKLYQEISDYLKGVKDTKQIVIDLSSISESLSTSSLSEAMLTDDFLKSQYESMPVCTSEVTESCRQKDLTFEQFKKMTEDEMVKIEEESSTKEDQTETKIIPQSIDIYESFTIKDKFSPSFGQNMLDKGKYILKTINTTSYVLIAILVVIIVIIILMFYKEPSQIMKILGVGFLVTAILILLFSALGLFAPPIINGLIQAEQADLANVGLAVVPFIGSIIGAITLKIVIVGSLLLIISIVLLIFSKKYKNKQ